jgi:hypothetical protein
MWRCGELRPENFLWIGPLLKPSGGIKNFPRSEVCRWSKPNVLSEPLDTAHFSKSEKFAWGIGGIPENLTC